MFIDSKEADARVSSLDNLINKLELRKLHNGGRPKGRKNDTTESRAVVAQHAIVHGPSETAREFNTTPSRASLLSNGIVTHGIGSDEELAPVVNNKKEKVHQKALDIIVSALDELDSKIGGEMKARDLASIAADMARIAEKTSPKQVGDDNAPKVNVVIYAPRIRDEGEYEVIECNG